MDSMQYMLNIKGIFAKHFVGILSSTNTQSTRDYDRDYYDRVSFLTNYINSLSEFVSSSTF